MNGNSMSLRALVDKWLAPTRSIPAHVTQTGRFGSNGVRYVCLEGQVSARPLSIVFFRHGSGAWDVFPPLPPLAAMGTRLFAA
ncbi:hypothetical protein AB3X82_19085 [Paraburkholderia phenoliruptrix]|uniref:Uncharacterized protein n=1 Tax=Paraburkholderia phenoliruptrix TaxID=252970 RepID=A0ABV3WFX4_9BURK|nr:hypothetical protein [Paraburkholderia phenoliruptrix]MDR6390946.1 hypothetical protein [Paraburkholderia phenoliruptrix]